MALNVLATDNFNRTENPLASPWTSYAGVDGLRATGTVCTGVTPAVDNAMLYGGTGVGTDQWCEFTIGTVIDNGTKDAGLILRAQAGGFYAWYFYDGAVKYNTTNSFSGQTTLDTRDPPAVTGSVLRFEAVISGGNAVLRCYLNDVQVGADITTASGPQSGGTPGAFAFSDFGSGGPTFDSWRMGDFGSSVALDQEGFRWYADDGSESGSTALAAQDTGITAAAGEVKRLRTIINATGDPATTQWKLQYKLSTDGAWSTLL
jgi:hypothetical protein